MTYRRRRSAVPNIAGADTSSGAGAWRDALLSAEPCGQHGYAVARSALCDPRSVMRADYAAVLISILRGAATAAFGTRMVNTPFAYCASILLSSSPLGIRNDRVNAPNVRSTM
jgi:hypothetical protein